MDDQQGDKTKKDKSTALGSRWQIAEQKKEKRTKEGTYQLSHRAKGCIRRYGREGREVESECESLFGGEPTLAL